MCSPIAAIGAGISALQVYGQVETAKGQVAAQEQAAKGAYRNANSQQSALNSQRVIASQQAVEKITKDQLGAAQAASAARVSAGEAGISGVGINRIVGDIGQQLGQETAVTQTNLLRQQSSLGAKSESVQMGLEDTIKGLQVERGPSPLEAALTIGMGAYSGGQMGTAMGYGSGVAMNGAGQVVQQNLTGMDFFKSALGYGEFSPITGQQAGEIGKSIGTTDYMNVLLNGERQQTNSMKQKYNLKIGG
jgi:hypothetical protein